MTRKFNVLVVDDEPPLRSVLRTSLSACGFAVEEAGSAEQALESSRSMRSTSFYWTSTCREWVGWKRVTESAH